MSAAAIAAFCLLGATVAALVAAGATRLLANYRANDWLRGKRHKGDTPLDGVESAEKKSRYFGVASLTLGLLALTFAVPVWTSGAIQTGLVGLVSFFLGALIPLLIVRISAVRFTYEVLWRRSCKTDPDNAFCAVLRGEGEDLSKDRDARIGATVKLADAMASGSAPVAGHN